MRLAGTCSRYSSKAMPQLANAASIHGWLFISFRCAYQAKVMKTLEQVSRIRVCREAGMVVVRNRTGAIVGSPPPDRLLKCRLSHCKDQHDEHASGGGGDGIFQRLGGDEARG